MQGILQRLKERKAFQDATDKAREEERARCLSNGALAGPPIFNRRIFGIGTIAITATAVKVMKKNEQLVSKHAFHLTESESLVLTNIVDSLKLIHRGRSHVKLAIANCLSHETHKAFELLEIWPHEPQFSCYYILQGSLETTYEPSAIQGSAARQQMFQPDIVYTHGMGEYLGLLAHGAEGDLAPAATIYCKTDSELLRIDRGKFHALMAIIEAEMRRDTEAFLNADWNFLSELTDAEKTALAPHLVKETLRSESLVVRQGDRNEWLYFLTSGRCQSYRTLTFQVDGQKKSEAFALRTYDKGDMFGEGSPLEGSSSSLSVCTKSQATVYRLHRSQLTVTGRQHLCRLIREHAGSVPTDAELRERRSVVRSWEAFRVETVTALSTHRRENFSKIKRIQSAPSSLSSRLKSRQLEFISGEAQSKVRNGKPHRDSFKSAPNDKNERLSIAPKEAKATARKVLLSSTVSNFILTSKQKNAASIDSREIHRKFANKDYENKVKQGWIFEAETLKEDMASNCFSMIDTGDFVTRAKTAAREQAERVKSFKSASESEKDDWHSSLEADHTAAIVGLAFNRLRLHILKRQMHRFEKPAKVDQSAAVAKDAATQPGVRSDFNDSKKSQMRRRNAARFVENSDPQVSLSASLSRPRPINGSVAGQGAVGGPTPRRNALESGRLWMSANPSGERFVSMYTSSLQPEKVEVENTED